MKTPTTSDVIDVTSGLFGLVLIGSGAWYWCNSNVQAHSTKQIAETAARDIRETAECHMEAFKMRPGSTEAALEIQAEFMDLCMAAREYVFLSDCTERMRDQSPRSATVPTVVACPVTRRAISHETRAQAAAFPVAKRGQGHVRASLA